MRIGIFPLNIVLFPDASYPLHIFEERYKVLVNESLESSEEFGITLIEERTIRHVGCLVHVSRLLKRHDDGRMDIVVTGTSRFAIGEIQPTTKPYTVADVTLLPDTDPQPDFDVLDKTIMLYNQLIESVYGDTEDPLNPSDWVGGGAAFRIAQKSGLEPNLRQQLLEMLSENERLHFLYNYLNNVVPKIKQVEKIQMLTRNDGYTNDTGSEK